MKNQKPLKLILRETKIVISGLADFVKKRIKYRLKISKKN